MKKTAGCVVLVPVLVNLVLMFVFAAIPSTALADGHEESGKLEHRVDLENKSGINLFIGKLYNDHRVLFALVVTFTMAVMGIIIGQAAGYLLRLCGLR